MENKTNAKKIIISLLGIAVASLVLILLYNQFKPQPAAGSKKITAEVVFADGTSKSFDIQTDAEYLRQALEQINLISGTESDTGLYVTTVDGVTANESNQEWWCFTKNKGTLNTGVDATPIANGDHFEITLTTGW